MVSSPTVSVVMPAYNAAAYLDESIRSILNQTFPDFEFIIINDGSSDDTGWMLDEYRKVDSRIRVYHQENMGLVSALNRGCRLARGKYIARMDADDASFPERLERQVEYIEKHPHIGIVGTWIYMEKDGLVIGSWCPSTSSKVLKWDNFFGVCVCHATVLMRRDVIERLNFYRHEALHSEDGDLWLRASTITEFGNVPEVLYKVRVSPGSTSQIHRQLAWQTHVRFLASFIRKFLKVDPPIEAVAGLRQTRVGPPIVDPRQIRLTAALIQKLYHNFVKENVLSSREHREISWDAAKRVASLALQASRFDTLGFVSLFIQALKLDYRLLYPSAIMRGIQRVFEKRIQTGIADKLQSPATQTRNCNAWAPEPNDQLGRLSEHQMPVRQGKQ
jgi:glycosyltransferase involved in cell wall biosynthesis